MTIIRIGCALGALVVATGSAFAAGPAVVYVSPNPLGVNDYLKAGAEGAKTVAEELGGSASVYESVDPITRKRDLDAAAKTGADIVVSIGFEFTDVLTEVAPIYPDTKFIAVDYCPADQGDNVYCVSFREHEMSFLAGAEAAWLKPQGTFGAIGGLDIPLLHRYTDSFLAGVQHASSEAKVVNTQWVAGSNPFSDPARASQIASSMYFEGVDTIIAAAGASGAGVIDAAKSMPGKTVVGADRNHCPDAPQVVIDNVEKRSDVAVKIAVKAAWEGTLAPQLSLGLAEGGVALSTMTGTDGSAQCLGTFDADVTAKVAQLFGEIVSGAVVVSDPMNP